uniref:IgGFc_binding domain-containing protein n=1 Tax=Rhabditophanes sp. KR3021 TaxID=114890 RepID=A0AC35TPA5_9BILA
MLTAFGDTKRFEKVVCEPNCIAIVADTFNANFFKINGANVSDMSTGFVIRTNPFNGDAISEVSIKIKSNLPNIPVSVYNNGQESMNFTIIVQTNSDSLEDIKITAQNYFNFGNNYTIKIGDLENELNMVHEYDDSNKCSAADIVFGAAHFTSQWAPSFDNIRIDDRKKMINITFSGAPSQFCIEEYQIDLMNNVDKILFIPQTNKEEQNTDVYSTLISCINLNDPRVIIIIFESECLEIDVTSIPLYTEKLYILPRDKKLLMNNALSLTSRFSTDSTSTQELLSDVDSVYDDINQNKEEDDCTTHFPLNESDQDMAVALGISTFDRTSQICEETV